MSTARTFLHDLLSDRDDGALAERFRALRGSGADLLRVADDAKQLALTDVEAALRISGALERFAQPHETRLRARAMCARAHALSYANRFAEACDLLSEAARIAASADEPVERGFALLAAVQPMARLGRLAEASQSAEDAGTAFRSADMPREAAMADVNLGIVLRMREMPRRAMECLERARAPLAGDPARLAALESNYAEALLDLDQFEQAEAAFVRAAAAFEAADNVHAAAIVEGNLAHLMSRQGRIDAALDRFERARRRYERSGASGDLARLDAEQAEALATIGAAREALACFRRAVEQLDAVGLAREAASARLGEGLALARLGDLLGADAVLRDAGDRFAALGQAVSGSEVSVARAELALRRNRPGDAIDLLRGAVQILAHLPARQARARLALASARIAVDELPAAEELLESVEQTVRRLHLAPLRPQTHRLRAELALRRGDPSAARTQYRSALTALERVRSSLRADRLRSAFSSDAIEYYQDAWRAALDSGEPSAAFDAIERSRARQLLELLDRSLEALSLRDGPAECEAESRLLQELARVESMLSVAYDRLGLLGEQRADAPDAAPIALSDLERRHAEIESRLAATRRFAPISSAPLTLERAAAAVPADTAWLSYFADGDAVSVMIVRREGCTTLRRICRYVDVLAGVRRLNFQVERALVRGASPESDGPIAYAARLLGERLVAPALAVAGDRPRWVVSPFGAMHGVPFAILHAGGAALLERCEVCYAPSVSIGVRLSERPADATSVGELLAVGVGDEFAPMMPSEAEAIAAGGERRAALTDAHATASEFLRRAPMFRIVHLATHCVYSGDNPLSSRVKFSDRWLSARQIAAMRLPGALVVLAGCESGRSAADSGEDRHGLIRAFLVAGANRVVASLWRLHDVYSGKFFREFYRRLGGTSFTGRQSPAAALRDVQREMRASGVPMALWSGLFVAGGVS